MELVYSESFMKSLALLDPPVQSAVKIAMFDLQTNPRTPGFNLEKLLANDLHSGRINDNLRLIMDMDDDRTVALYVDNHDDAYRWADNHRLRMKRGKAINPARRNGTRVSTGRKGNSWPRKSG